MYIEIIVFLYNMAFSTTFIVESLFFTYQACHNDFNYTKEICLEIERHPKIHNLIHKKNSLFQTYHNILFQTICFLTSITYVHYFKKKNKRNFIILGLCGKTYYSLMVIINSLFEFKLFSLLYTAIIPCALTGGDMLIFSNAFAFLSEHVSYDKKIFRVTLLQTIILSSIPLGTYIGKILFKQVELFKNSFINMFGLNCILLITAIILSLFLSDDIKEKKDATREEEAFKEISFEEIELINVSEEETSMRHMKKKETTSPPGKIKIIILILISGIHVSQRSEKQYLYMYTQNVLKWSFDIFSIFKVIQSSSLAIVSLLVSLILIKINIKKLYIIFIAVLGNISSRLIFIFSNTKNLFYLGAVFCGTGSLIYSSIKAEMLILIPKTYVRKILLITHVIENLFIIIVSVLYNYIYTNFVKKWMFCITISSELTILFLSILYFFKK